jgi:hypothetical protein
MSDMLSYVSEGVVADVLHRDRPVLVDEVPWNSVHRNVERHHPVEGHGLLPDVLEEELEACRLYVEERFHAFDGSVVELDAPYISVVEYCVGYERWGQRERDEGQSRVGSCS